MKGSSALTLSAVTSALATTEPKVAKRSIININPLGVFDYAFINHWLSGDQYGPVGDSAATGLNWNKAYLDATGYPKAAEVKPWGIGIRVPESKNYPGVYVLSWDGDGEVEFNLDSGRFVKSGGKNATETDANRRWANTRAGSVRLLLNYSGPRQLFPVTITKTNHLGNGYCRNIKFYRLEDEPDLLAGNIFRRKWKQLLVDLCPGAIRFMDWTRTNDAKDCRFENRTLPDYASFGSGGVGFNWVSSLPYGDTSGVNQMRLKGVIGTPALDYHGELVTCRIGSSADRNGKGAGEGVFRAVKFISKARNGRVVCAAHGFSTGDVIIHIIPDGMTQLDHFPCTITVIDANTYDTNVDTSGFDKFSRKPISNCAGQFISLAVGSRAAHPVVFSDGLTSASSFGDGYIAAGDYKTFYFDKTIAAQRDSAGAWIYGAWIFNNLGSNNGHDGGVPLEICTALINELMAMKPSAPIDMWINIPHRGLSSMDPDYTTGSNWATNAVGVILNGANGYAGLDSRCNLMVEYSNETWNSAGSGFSQTPFLARRGDLRWDQNSGGDYASMATLRSSVAMRDIKSKFPNNPRLRFVLAGQGTVGIAVGSLNDLRVNGTTNFLADVLNPKLTAPIADHDYFAWAAYVYNDDSNPSNNLEKCTAAWLAAGTDKVQQEKAFELYVNGIRGSGGETLNRYYNVLLPEYASALVARGKKTIMYEGGWDHSVTDGTASQNAFLVACKKSHAWSYALISAFDKFLSTTGAELPAEYLQLDPRWGHADPDLYSNGVEGAGLDKAWFAMGERNRNLA